MFRVIVKLNGVTKIDARVYGTKYMANTLAEFYKESGGTVTITEE